MSCSLIYSLQMIHYFFCRAEVKEIRAIKKILRLFELISELKMNLGKSSIFGIIVGEEELNSLAEIMGCKVGKLSLRYLGLPIV